MSDERSGLMSESLRECPFCGSIPELGEHNFAHSSWQPRYDVACRNDRCIMQRTYETEAVAVATWNTRPVEDELLKKFEQLRAKWDAIPWGALSGVVVHIMYVDMEAAYGNAEIIEKWINDNAPDSYPELSGDK